MCFFHHDRKDSETAEVFDFQQPQNTLIKVNLYVFGDAGVIQSVLGTLATPSLEA